MNTGDVPLRDVALVDSLGLQPQRSGGGDGDDQLARSETWTYRAEASAAKGEPRSVATVTAFDSAGNRVTDEDASHYTGVMRAVIGDTVWNDRDGNAAPSPGEPGVPGARVTITNRATGARQMVTTDAMGAYRAAVEPGTYDVTLDMDSVDGELTTPDEFEFSVDEGETFLGADFGLDDFGAGAPLPFTGSATGMLLRLGVVLLATGALVVGVLRSRTRATRA
jgi:hypothetical protein